MLLQQMVHRHIQSEVYLLQKVDRNIQFLVVILRDLPFSVAGGVTSGTVYIGKSFLNLLTDKLDNYLKFNSILDTKIDGLNDTLSDADKRIALQDRMDKLTLRYQRQYSAMESSIASFQETGNMLTAMLEQKD